MAEHEQVRSGTFVGRLQPRRRRRRTPWARAWVREATLAALVGVHGGWYAGRQHGQRRCDLSAVASPLWPPLPYPSQPPTYCSRVVI
ncbi:hypothetical protein ACQJBY_009434 [Aegilops geniculata]